MANMTFGVNLIPKTDNTYSLGDSDHRWNIYGDNIGGRNLTLDTGIPTVLTHAAGSTNSWLVPAFGYTSDYGFNNLELDVPYTVSFNYTITGADTFVNGRIGLRSSETGYMPVSSTNTINIPVGDSSGHYSQTFFLTESQLTYGTRWLVTFVSTSNRNMTMTITNFKFEKGSIETDWTLAPEDNDAYKIYYGVCSTAATTQVKEVTIDGITSLYTGLQVRIYFNYEQLYDGQPFLNINSLGDKAITIQGVIAGEKYMWPRGALLDFTYNGERFLCVDHSHASTAYYGQTKLLDSISSTSTSFAATPNSVKQAYDLANTAATQNITMARLPLISRTYYPEMQVGGISTETGNNTSSTNASGKARSRSVDRISYNGPVTITADTGYSYLILMYTSDDTYNEASASWMTGSNSVPECGSYRLLVKNDNISDFTDVPNTFITVTDNLNIQERFNQLYIPTASGVSF